MAYRLGNRILNIDNKMFYSSGVAPVNPVWSGLTSYWRLDETSGNVYDAVNNVTGTLNSGSLNNAGKNNTCWQGTGSGKGIVVNTTIHDFERTDAFSINVWLLLTASGFYYNFCGKVNTSSPYAGYMLRHINNNTWTAEINSASTGSLIAGSTIQITTGNWYMATFTYDGSSLKEGIKLYTNSTPNYTYGTTNSISSSIKNTKNFTIGGNDIPSLPFIGKVDEVAMWNRALSQDEITTLYNSGNGLFY